MILVHFVLHEDNIFVWEGWQKGWFNRHGQLFSAASLPCGWCWAITKTTQQCQRSSWCLLRWIATKSPDTLQGHSDGMVTTAPNTSLYWYFPFWPREYCTVLIICFDLIYFHFIATCCRISSQSLKLPHFGSATSRPPLVLRALGGPVAPPLDLEGCRRFKLTVKTLGVEILGTLTIILGTQPFPLTVWFELKHVMMQCFKVAIMAIPQIRLLKHWNLADLCFWRTWDFHVLHLGRCQWTFFPGTLMTSPSSANGASADVAATDHGRS